MFSSEFFPTPENVIDLMISNIDLTNKIVLEPSAGKGNIIDYLKKIHAKPLACELNSELALIVANKCQLLKHDFFDVTKEEISHVEFIVMNPPFSNADKHILHAFDIAPEGCQIISLCNSNTLENRYSHNRNKLNGIVENFGYSEYIGDVFSSAERKTDVNVSIVRLFKPQTGENEFNNYFFDMNEEQENTVNNSGIVQHNEIREIVNRFVGAVKMFDSVMSSNNAINDLMKPFSYVRLKFGAFDTSERYSTEINREAFKKKLQKAAWNTIFDKMNMQKYVTQKLMSNINKFVEQQIKVPFTMINIFKMIELVIGTHKNRMDSVLVETFDYICSLSADNSEVGEKWKTNSNYKINKRFIIGWITEIGWNGEMKIRYTSNQCLDDINKAICFISGTNFSNITKLSRFVDSNKIEWGQWYEWGFFRIRGYKKGTMHFEFINENIWFEFNRQVAKIKGWAIPKQTDRKTKGTERTKQTAMQVY